MTRWLAALLLSLPPAGSLMAHHSLANVDTTKPVRVKGTIVRFHPINPHSFIYLDEAGADGARRRWAVEGPSLQQLTRRSHGHEALTPGAVIEVCGYVAGRLITAEVLIMPDGREQNWGDYGVHKCFPPGFKDQHSK